MILGLSKKEFENIICSLKEEKKRQINIKIYLYVKNEIQENEMKFDFSLRSCGM